MSGRHAGSPFGRAALALAVAISLSPAGAWADEPSAAEVAKAREEFRRGIALEAAGDWTGALAAFKSVALVKSTPQVRYHIARCEEETGDYVGAFGSYQMALFEAQQAKVKDAEAAAVAALAALEPKIPKLTIKRGAGADVARIVLDGRELGPSTIGTPMSANPGPHHIEATAPSREPATIDVTLAESEKREVEVTLEKAKVEPPPAPKDEQPKPPPPKLPPPPPSASPVRTAGFVIGGAGVAGLGASAIFFGLKQSAISDLDAVCGPDRQSCPASAASTRDSGQLYSTLSMATFIGGLAATAGGVAMIVFAPKPDAPAVGLVPFVQGSPAGVTVVGRF